MAHQIAEFQQQRDAALQDAANKLSAGDRDRLLAQAILQRYSKDRPREIVTDVIADGTSDLPLPSSPDAFEDGFSVISSIEYPVGNVPAGLLLDEEWQMYRSPSALKIRLLAVTPPNSATARVTWSGRHKDDGSTVPSADFEAVCDYAASLCFEALAAIYAQTGDSTLGADTVNYRSKSQEYLGLAKAARKRYFDHVGVADSGPAGGGTGPAISIGSTHDSIAGTGIDRLTHPSANR